MTWADSGSVYGGLGPEDLGPDAIIDDADRLSERDPDGQLVETGYAGSMVRRTLTELQESGLLASIEPPVRYFVVFAGYGAKDAAKAVAALAAEIIAAPALIRQTFGDRTPWLGFADVVLILSDTGADEASIRAAQIALQRGSTVVVSTAPDSPLDALCRAHRGTLVVSSTPQSSNAIWTHVATGLAVSELLRESGRGESTDASLETLADAIDRTSAIAGPLSPAANNPAKMLALDCLGATPLAVSDSPLAAAAAYRFASKTLATQGIPIAHVGLPAGLARMHAVLEGPYVRPAGDLFFDPYEEGGPGRPSRPLRVVLFTESTDVSSRTAITQMARERGVGLSIIAAEGECPAARLASLLQVADVAAAYLPIISKSNVSKGREE